MAITPIPDGYTTVTPWLISPDTSRLIEYVTSAFGEPHEPRYPHPRAPIRPSAPPETA
jgi:PhnB protein